MNHLFIINKLKNKISLDALLVLPKNSGLEKYKQIFEELPNKKVIVRAEDVPIFVEKLTKKSINCIGLTGSDLYFNYQLSETKLNVNETKLNILEEINWFDKNALFKKPTICLMGKKIKDLNKSIIAINSKYKNIANDFLKNYSPKEIIYFNGATETSATLGISDFVIDIVYSGKSAKESNLQIIQKILESNMVIIGGRK